MPDDPAETTVHIPGTVIATYKDGRITKMVFLPSGSCAGYFGPSAEVLDGDDDLDVESVDGPFWRAVQAMDFTIEWEE